jgi:hypothetical protein
VFSAIFFYLIYDSCLYIEMYIDVNLYLLFDDSCLYIEMYRGGSLVYSLFIISEGVTSELNNENSKVEFI